MHTQLKAVTKYISPAQVCIRLYFGLCYSLQSLSKHSFMHTYPSTDFVNKRDKVFKVKLQINFHFDSMLFTYSIQRGTL